MPVGLDVAVPEGHGRFEGGQGVLGPVTGAAAVREGNDTGVVEKGPGSAGGAHGPILPDREGWLRPRGPTSDGGDDRLAHGGPVGGLATRDPTRLAAQGG